MLFPFSSWTPRHWARAALVTAALITILWVLYAARVALTPFLLGLFMAYLVLPAVDWLQAHLPPFLRHTKAGRVLAIVFIYIAGLSLIAAFFALLVPAIIAQAEQLIANWDQIAIEIQGQFAAVRDWYLTSLPPQLRASLDAQVQQIVGSILVGAQQGIVGGLVVVTNAISITLGYLAVPVWVFLILYDARPFQRALINVIPEVMRSDILNLGRIANDVAGAYVRSQIVIAAVLGGSTTIALALLGVNFALLLGFLAGILDLIPTLGPFLAAIPTMIIASFQRPILALWAFLAIFGVVQLESVIIVPRIVGGSVRVRTAVIILLLVIGSALWGLLGLVIIVPLAAMLRDMVHYLYIRTAPASVSPDAALQYIRNQRHAKPAD